MVAAQVAGRDPVEGLPGAGAVPGVVQRPGEGVVARPGPIRRASWIAAGSVERSWKAFLRRVTWTCWLAPDFQRSPTEIWLGSAAEGVMVTSASRVRSSRLRSLSLVVRAAHRAGRSAMVTVSWSGPGSSGRACACTASAASASARSVSLASHRASRLRATSRFSGSQARKARSARSAA